jgi:hypothetical protein
VGSPEATGRLCSVRQADHRSDPSKIGDALATCVFVKAELDSHTHARQTVRTLQNDTAPFRQRPGNTVTTNLSLQIHIFLRTQHQRRDRPASHTRIRHKLRALFDSSSDAFSSGNCQRLEEPAHQYAGVELTMAQKQIKRQIVA